MSKYFIKQPATAGTAGQVLSLNSDLELVWKNDASTPTFDKDDVPSTYDAKGDVYIPDAGITALTQGAVHFGNPLAGTTTRATVISDITASGQMTAMVGIALTTSYTDGLLIKGIINVGSNVGTSVGQVIYLTGTGGLSSTAPTGTGEYVRGAGYYLGDNKVFFNPSQDFILLS